MEDNDDLFYRAGTGTVNFKFKAHNGEEVRGRITSEALEDDFGARGGSEHLIAAYRANSSEIHRLAERAIAIRGDAAVKSGDRRG